MTAAITNLLRANAALPLEHQHSSRTVNSLRVLWLSPWSAADRVQAEARRRRGVDVLLVTLRSAPGIGRGPVITSWCSIAVSRAATWPATLAAWRQIREYRPDVVIAEMVGDPRWIALPGQRHIFSWCTTIPRLGRTVVARLHTCLYSSAGARVRRPPLPKVTRSRPRSPPGVSWPAPECMWCRFQRPRPGAVPSVFGPEDRHDFVMIGRLNAYKNVDVVLEAWQRHVAGDGWRGDDLVFIGDGSAIAGALPKHTRWRPGGSRYCDVVATLAAAKGSVAHCRRASQSGVQVLSMQLGVTPIVSTAGGLPKFQPPGCPPVGVDDVAGLATAFDELADPCTATLRGAAAARHSRSDSPSTTAPIAC